MAETQTAPLLDSWSQSRIFFSKMSRLCEESDKLLARQETDADDLEIARESLQESIRSLKKLEEAFKADPHTNMNVIFGTDLYSWLHYVTGKYPEQSPSAELIEQIPQLEKLSSELDSASEAPKGDPKWKELMLSLNPPAQANWNRLANLCSKLEALSKKQLQGVPFNQDDTDFISNYGMELAGAMVLCGKFL